MDFDLDIDRESPFQPGFPVSPDNFKGRRKSIKKILRYFPNAKKGEVQHFFLTGKRGMGKTSLAQYVQNTLEINHDVIGVYVTNKGKHTLDELVNSIIESLLKNMKKDSLKDKIMDLFGNIECITVKGNSLKFKPTKSESEDIINNFPYILNDLINELPNNNGVFLIIDDINGLSESKKFVDWYKGFADTVAVDNSLNIPLYILFAGYPEKFDNLVLEEESFGRIFHYENISNLDDEDVKEFFIDTFSKVNISVDEESLNILTRFSSGLPLMMQQIGDSIFWMAEDSYISKRNMF